MPAPAVLDPIPALFTWAWLEFPECPSPMTAGTEDSKHAGPSAFQAWPLHITRDQPKITACLVMLQDNLGLGCRGFRCCSPLSIPGVVISIPPLPPHHSPQPLSHRQFCKSDIACRILPPPWSWGLPAAVVAAGAAQHPALTAATVGGRAGERLQGSHRLAWLFGGHKGRLCLHATVWTNAGHGSCHPRKSQTRH